MLYLFGADRARNIVRLEASAVRPIDGESDLHRRKVHQAEFQGNTGVY